MRLQRTRRALGRSPYSESERPCTRAGAWAKEKRTFELRGNATFVHNADHFFVRAVTAEGFPTVPAEARVETGHTQPHLLEHWAAL